MGPLHEEMRERRERAGLTLQAIHVATRISTDFLNAIEEGNFKFLPKPYIRLFLRTYANKVGMDPQYVLDRYEDIDRPNEEGEGGRSTTLLPDRPLSWGVTVGMAVGFLLLGFAGASLFKRAAEDVPPAVSPGPTQVVPDSGVGGTDPEGIGGTGAEFTPKPSTEEVPHGISWTERDSFMVLHAVCVELTWLDILADDRHVFRGFMEPGDERIWQARGRFSVVSGRPRGVVFSLQEHPLPWVRPGVSGVLRITVTRTGVKREKPPPAPLSDSLSSPSMFSEPRIGGRGSQEPDLAPDDSVSERGVSDPSTIQGNR